MLRKITSDNALMGTLPDARPRPVATHAFHYGSIKRIHSVQGLQGMRGRPEATMTPRTNSFHDLPLVAVAGIHTRVSIGNRTSAVHHDLPDLFNTDADHIEAVEIEGGWTLPLVLSACGALLSALAFGYNNANMNTQAVVMRAALGIPSKLDDGCVPLGHSSALPANDVIWGFCVSAFCLSALLGSTVAGQVADRHGRRLFLLGNSILYILGALLEAAAGPLTMDAGTPTNVGVEVCSPTPRVRALCVLLFGRLLTGVACGGSTVAVPMYLGETAPAHLRGTLGSAFLLTAVTGMLFGQLAGLPSFLGTNELWPWILAGAAIPALAQLLFFQPLLVESPRWLLLHGQPALAAECLARLRGCALTDVELIEELDGMGDGMGLVGDGGANGNGAGSMRVDSKHSEAAALFDAALREPMMSAENGSRLSMAGGNGGGGGEAAPWGTLGSLIVNDPAMRRPLCVCITLMAAQQLSGINNAFNYSTTFFLQNGMSDEVVTWIAISMNVSNVLVVLLSTVLMDRVGRRPLLLTSIIAMGASTLLLTAGLLLSAVPLVMVGIVLFVMSFGLGLGPVVWLLPAELFPMSKRAPATAAVTSINWLANFVVGQSFPILAGWLGSLAFLPFAAVLGATALFAYQHVPETRGRTLEDITQMLEKEI